MSELPNLLRIAYRRNNKVSNAYQRFDDRVEKRSVP